MPINIQKIALNDLQARRQVLFPRFDFVESSVSDAQVFQIDENGYFIVAPENSLLPRFVIELKLPKIGDLEYYKELSFLLNDNSCGFMWFDSADFDAMDFTWRLNLPVKLGPPLLIWNENSNPKTVDNEFRVEHLTSEYEVTARNLLTSQPFHKGGQTGEAFQRHYEDKRILKLNKGNESLGVAVLTPQKGYTHISMVLEEDKRNLGNGKLFMQIIADQLLKNGSKAVIGMPPDSPQTYVGSKSLGMIEIRRGMKCMIASSIF